METRKVWLVKTNSDLTEGRGTEYVAHVCELESTAIRLSKNSYVQGSDAPIQESQLIFHEGIWYQPGPNVVRPTVEDIKIQHTIDTARLRKKEKEEVLERARLLGLTDEEIEILRR